MTALPKTISGKIRRVELRRRAAMTAADGAPPPGEPTFDLASLAAEPDGRTGGATV